MGSVKKSKQIHWGAIATVAAALIAGGFTLVAATKSNPSTSGSGQLSVPARQSSNQTHARSRVVFLTRELVEGSPSGLSEDGKLGFDEDYLGHAIIVAGDQFVRGVAMHPETKRADASAVFRVPVGATRFEAVLGMAGSRVGDSYGTATGIVELVYANGRTQEVFRGELTSHADTPPGTPEVIRHPVQIEFSGAIQLRLIVRPGQRIWNDNVVWADAKFIVHE